MIWLQEAATFKHLLQCSILYNPLPLQMCFIPALCLITQEQHYQLSEADVPLWSTATPQVASIHLNACVTADRHSWCRTIHLHEENRSKVIKTAYGKVLAKENMAMVSSCCHFSKKDINVDGKQERLQDWGLWRYWHHWHSGAIKSVYQHWNSNKEDELPCIFAVKAANRSSDAERAREGEYGGVGPVGLCFWLLW